MHFKTNIIHRIEKRGKLEYYSCNQAIGPLSSEQLRIKTNKFGKEVTCKKCLKEKKK